MSDDGDGEESFIDDNEQDTESEEWGSDAANGGVNDEDDEGDEDDDMNGVNGVNGVNGEGDKEDVNGEGDKEDVNAEGDASKPPFPVWYASIKSPGPDARLASLFSCLSLSETLFVPTAVGKDGPITGTAPPNKKTISKDGAKTHRRATDGLYAAWFENGAWRLRVPGTDPAKSWEESDHATAEDLRDAIDAFRERWPLVEVRGRDSGAYVAHQHVSTPDETLMRYPLNENTLGAIEKGTLVRPIDVLFWKSHKKSEEKDIMHEVIDGSLLYSPETRGDLVRLHNASVLSDPRFEYARLMTCFELMRECADDVKESLFVGFTGKPNRNINDKNIILYNFCLKGGSAPLNPRLSSSTSSDDSKETSNSTISSNGLKKEQEEAAKAFAKSETRCSLLYWSPGVGKTLGAWAAIVEAAKVEATEGRGRDLTIFTTGVTFLSSGRNLPEHKFVAELESNAKKLGVEITRSKKQPVKTWSKARNPTPYAVGWHWEIKMTTNEGTDLTFKVLACTYLGFARGSATLLFGSETKEPWFESGHDELFTSPRTTCDLVLNVCDEAHVLRATKLSQMRDAKTSIHEEVIKGLPGVISKPKRYHRWAWPTTQPNYSKIPWEGLRVADNAYDEKSPGKLPENKVVKTLLTTATPFGNSPSHLPNLFACGLYAANAEKTYLGAVNATRNTKKGEDGDEISAEIVKKEEDEDKKSLDKEVEDANKAEIDRYVKDFVADIFARVIAPVTEPISAGPNGDVESIARSTAVMKHLLYGPANGADEKWVASVNASVATIDPATAPRQDFGCCHFFSGEGGTVIAPGGTVGRTGGVPWSQPKLVEAAVIEPMEPKEKVEGEGEEIYAVKRSTRNATIENYVRNIKSRVDTENGNETSTYVVTYREVDAEHDGYDAGLKTKDVTANVRGPLRVEDGKLIANLVKKKKAGEKEIHVLCEDVEKIERDPPVSLIRRVDMLYVRRREKKTIRPIEDAAEKSPPGENANANANAPEGERQDGADPAVALGDREDDESDESDESDDDGDFDVSSTRYEDVGIYYWRWGSEKKTEVERVSLADLGEDKDDDEEGTKGVHTMEDTRKEQLARLRGLYSMVYDESAKERGARSKSDATGLTERDVRGSKKWYEHFVSGDQMHTDPRRSTFLRKHLRAYSPRYELFFRMLENDVVADRRRTPVIVFFRKIRGFSLETLGGFEWYADMRDRHRHADFPALDGTKRHRYWFLKFKTKDSTEPFAYDETTMRQNIDGMCLEYQQIGIEGSASVGDDASKITTILQKTKTVAACLMFYRLIFESIVAKRSEREKNTKEATLKEATLKEGVLRRVRELLWIKVEKRKGEDEDSRDDFINYPGKHHVVISVTGDQGENAREWASYLLDESTGAYNHPVNRFGEIVRVMAGADKIGESNDFRSTRHMFFMNPETDVVKLLQKFGRICRSSDPTRYPYYEYGFHRDHLGDDGDEVPIVHYVTLSLPTETRKAFDIIREKAKFYNPYSRLLAREKGDDGLVIRRKALEDDWRDAIDELRGVRPLRFKAFVGAKQKEERLSVLSNLYGDAEWDWAATYFERTDDDETILRKKLTRGGDQTEIKARLRNMTDTMKDLDGAVSEWLKTTKLESVNWTTDDLRRKIKQMFPEFSLNGILKTYEFDPVPTGVVPRLFLNNLFVRGIGQFIKPALEFMIEKTNEIKRDDEEVQIPNDDNLRLWKYLCANRVRETLREVMRKKFENAEYSDVLKNTNGDLRETQTAMAGLAKPYGYKLADSDAVLMGIREGLPN